MKRQIHNGLNAMLRVALSEDLSDPVGTWGLLGCYWNEPEVTWDGLDDLGQAVTACLREHGDAVTATALVAAFDHCTPAIGPDGFGIDSDRLRGTGARVGHRRQTHQSRPY
ncbi:hypothetical protein L0U85_03825 [Glycomyces sp. L485]|uniref:hypothetical protein n=1 Tax=Glycomyces sp. L485 TaxID=2909235 RepID=UPI001F4A7E8D|nr:hypothetical protein [Glycomyces sp. L485]MCH7229991.1 hypothetical protein [Glycomyces sp. L485]